MKIFGRRKAQAENEQVAYWRAQTVALAAEVTRVRDIAERFALTNLELSRELVRLSQHNAPVAVEGDVDQPKSTRDNDRVTLNDPERQLRPEPGPERVE